MAAIASVNGAQLGAFAAARTTLSADDTISYDAKRRQLLVLRNPTGASITVTVDGASAGTVTVAGLGVVHVPVATPSQCRPARTALCRSARSAPIALAWCT